MNQTTTRSPFYALSAIQLFGCISRNRASQGLTNLLPYNSIFATITFCISYTPSCLEQSAVVFPTILNQTPDLLRRLVTSNLVSAYSAQLNMRDPPCR